LFSLSINYNGSTYRAGGCWNNTAIIYLPILEGDKKVADQFPRRSNPDIGFKFSISGGYSPQFICTGSSGIIWSSSRGNIIDPASGWNALNKALNK